MANDLQDDLPNKLIPSSMRRRTAVNLNPSARQELEEARSSPAYWWYQCLRANDEYRYCCRHNGKGPLAETFKDFGDVFTKSFGGWWREHGKVIFQETAPLKKVVHIQSESEVRHLFIEPEMLILQIPLTMRKQVVMRQIGRILKKAYEGREIDVWKASTAKRKIIKSKIRMSTIERLLEVWRVRQRYPTISLFKVAEKANIELDFQARSTAGELMDEKAEIRRTTIAVSRLLAQARNLIDNAGMGHFPSLQPPSKFTNVP